MLKLHTSLCFVLRQGFVSIIFMLSYYKEHRIVVVSLFAKGSSGLYLDSPYQLSESDKRISTMEDFFGHFDALKCL